MRSVSNFRIKPTLDRVLVNQQYVINPVPGQFPSKVGIIDQKFVKRKRKFFAALFRDKSSVYKFRKNIVV